MSTEEIDDKYAYYLRDLSYVPESKWMQYVPLPETMIAFIKPTLEYISFTTVMIVHIFMSLFTDLTLPISQPFNFWLMVACIVIVVIFLFPLNIALQLAKLYRNSPAKFYEEDRWKKMLAKESNSIDDIVRNGRNALGSSVSDTVGPKKFDLDMAETLLILSTIIYDQNTPKVRKIHHKLKRSSELEYKSLEKECHEAHESIRNQAKIFELEFLPLSELGNLDALFAGMYWSEKDNFIVVAFKGTTPTNFTEWLADFLFIREDARNYVFGEIHKGFYDNFFPKPFDENKTSYPALRMVETIRRKALEIYNKRKEQNEGEVEKVNIWVTGHSLGAALAQVFYARLIKSNDLSDYCVLRDAFIFAGPAVGDKDFAFSFNGALNKRFKEQKDLWRIVNTDDIVPCVPPSYFFNTLRRYITNSDLLNYFQIGDKIHLYLNSKEPKGITFCEKMKLDTMTRGIDEKLKCDHLEKNKKNKFTSTNVKKLYDSYDSKGRLDCMNNYEFLLPSCFRNHLPHRYFIAMERLKSENIVPTFGFL